MADRTDVKYSILEKDGIEYDSPVEHIPDSQDIAFSDPDYGANNAKDAILEGSGIALGAAGFVMSFSTGSTAGTGKYLDYFPGTTTDLVPAPMASTGKLLDLGLRTVGTSTISVGIYKLVSGVETLVYTASLSGSDAVNYTNVNIIIYAGEDLVAKVISGSASRPSIALTIRRGAV